MFCIRILYIVVLCVCDSQMKLKCQISVKYKLIEFVGADSCIPYVVFVIYVVHLYIQYIRFVKKDKRESCIGITLTCTEKTTFLITKKMKIINPNDNINIITCTIPLNKLTNITHTHTTTNRKG